MIFEPEVRLFTGGYRLNVVRKMTNSGVESCKKESSPPVVTNGGGAASAQVGTDCPLPGKT